VLYLANSSLEVGFTSTIADSNYAEEAGFAYVTSTTGFTLEDGTFTYNTSSDEEN